MQDGTRKLEWGYVTKDNGYISSSKLPDEY